MSQEKIKEKEKKKEKNFPVLNIGEKIYSAGSIKEELPIVLDLLVKLPVNTDNLQLFHRIVELLWKAKFYDETLEVLETALKKYPRDTRLLEKGGEIYLEARQPEEALSVFQTLLNRFPRRYYYMDYLGMAYEQLGKKPQAMECYEKALAGGGKDPVFYLTRSDTVERLAKLCYNTKNYPKARQLLEGIMSTQPRSSKWNLYFKTLEKMGEEELLRKKKEEYEKIKNAKKHFELGERYLLQGKTMTAIKKLEKALELNPLEPHYHFALGNAYESLDQMRYENQFETATEYYEKAFELEPGNLFYGIALAGNLVTVKNWERAFEVARQVGKINGEAILPTFRYLLEVYGGERDYVNILKELIHEDPNGELVELRSELAILLREQGDDRSANLWFEDVADLYRKKIDEHPYNWRHYLDYAHCQWELGNVNSSLGFFLRARELFGGLNINIEEKLVEVYLKLDQYQKAKEILERLIPLSSMDSEYYGKLGMCFLYFQDYERAFESFNRSIALYRYKPEYLYGASVSAACLGRFEDVLDIIRDLLEMEPRFLDIIEQEPTFSEMKGNYQIAEILDKHRQKHQTEKEPEPVWDTTPPMPWDETPVEEPKEAEPQEETREEVPGGEITPEETFVGEKPVIEKKFKKIERSSFYREKTPMQDRQDSSTPFKKITSLITQKERDQGKKPEKHLLTDMHKEPEIKILPPGPQAFGDVPEGLRVKEEPEIFDAPAQQVNSFPSPEMNLQEENPEPLADLFKYLDGGN